ncbi:alpha/beta fold hydrolase [Nonomuraea angiospora]|uniref:alpha/beta fold hydrolase n=1 Tax=Nonomuraea angiospora TaxID=46172 RepID=UPI0029AACBB8|nr:alpha/beta hydrolase [Nonomuraea angiospora]MDX3100839.1 alpha/beta hydrolase [Nonomuraea angiospora]
MRLRRPALSEPAIRVVLLHGLGGGPSTWNSFAALAPPRLELWEADLPWSVGGTREWTHRPDPGRWVDDAIEGAEVVIAHSFAANLLLESLARGMKISAAVLVAPFYRASPSEFDWATIESYLAGFYTILDHGLRVTSGDRLSPDTRHDMAVKLREQLGPYSWMRFFDAYLRSPLVDTAAVTTPCLVISGHDDRAAPPRDGRALAEVLPRAHFETLAAGHLPMIEQAHVFAELVGDFVSALTLEIT